MIAKLINFIKSSGHTTDKKDVTKTLDNILTGLSSDAIPALDSLIQSANLPTIKNSAILRNMIRPSGISAKDNREFLVKVKGVMVNISKAGKNLENVVMKDMSEVMTDKTTTARDAAIMKVITDIGSMTTFVMDLSYYTLINGKSENTDLPNIKLKEIKEAIPTFTEMLRMYGKDFSKLINNLSKVSINIIDINDGNLSMADKLLAKNGKMVSLPDSSGFIGNPIYRIRLWLADKEVKKYEALKDKKRLLELKIMELKLQEEEESDSPKLKKQIEYYENKLSKIEYSIKEIEENIED